MEQEKINNYVDNLDVDTQANLLKKLVKLLIIFRNNEEITRTEESEVDFIIKQIEEFDKKYNLAMQDQVAQAELIFSNSVGKEE